MEEIKNKDDSYKATVLMKQALKKYEEGDFYGGDSDRKLANEYFDKASLELSNKKDEVTQLYGESINFGVLYNVIEQNLGNIYEGDTKEFLKTLYKTIKDDKILTEEFKIYDTLERTKGVKDSKTFVNDVLSLRNEYSKEQVKESNNKLLKLIKEHKFNEYVYIDKNLEDLYEAIEYVILEKTTFNNIHLLQNKKDVIVEYVEKNNKDNIQENSTIDHKTKLMEMVENYDNEYYENLNEHEKKIFDIFLDENFDRKKYFDKTKSETLLKLQETISKADDSDKEQWLSLQEKIMNKNYCDNISENIVNCSEMLEIKEIMNN